MSKRAVTLAGEDASPACEVRTTRRPNMSSNALCATGRTAKNGSVGEVTLELSVLGAHAGHTWSHPGLLGLGS